MKKNTINRVFEIVSEYRKLRYSNANFFNRTLLLIALISEYQFLPYYVGTAVPKWRLLLRRFLSKRRIMPDYVMTGPIKSGSTDLVTHLLFHPNVIAPLAKEFTMTESEGWRAYYPTVKKKKRLERKIKGPVRCGYLYPLLHDLKLIDKLYSINTQIKIIITLRDPVKRAYSHWKWEVFHGGKSLHENPHLRDYRSFVKRALDLHPSIPMDTFCGFPFLETGIYYKAVEIWIEKFGRENVLVLDAGQYFTDRQPILERIQTFLEIPITHISEAVGIINKNSLMLDLPDEASESALAEFYRPYNQKLFDLLEITFDWR